MNIICYVSLAVWDIPVGWKWTCFILAGAGYGLSGLIMAYVNLLSFLFLKKIILTHMRQVGPMKSAPTTTKNAPSSSAR